MHTGANGKLHCGFYLLAEWRARARYRVEQLWLHCWCAIYIMRVCAFACVRVLCGFYCPPPPLSGQKEGSKGIYIPSIHRAHLCACVCIDNRHKICFMTWVACSVCVNIRYKMELIIYSYAFAGSALFSWSTDQQQLYHGPLVLRYIADANGTVACL